MTLPVIDLGPFLNGNSNDRHQLATQVNSACRDTGFLIIVNHGVDPALPDRLFELAYKFFNQPFEEKLKVEKFEGSGPAGYHMFATQSNGLAYRNIQSKADLLKISPDLRESFGLSPERNGLNQWPSYPPGFRDVCLEYYARMENLAFSMIDLFTMALGLPEHFFDKFIDKHDSTVLMHHYPAQKDPPADGQLRSSPHTDLGMFTLLRHEREHKAGLQLKTKSGDWMDVPQVENAFVVNIADSMQQWTNDMWKSTFHRVLNPPREADGSTKPRIGLPFFFNVNQDALLECLPSCCGPDNPPKYAPVIAGDYRRARAKKTHEFLKMKKEAEAEAAAAAAANVTA